MTLLCKLLGHKMYLDSSDANEPSTCKRCGHKEPAGIWCNSCTKGYDGTNGNGYQPCGCNKQPNCEVK